MTVSDLVKVLEWHNFDAWTWWAEAVCGTYQVEERNGGWRVELRFHDARHVVTETDDFDAALSAAQADYTVRILGALDLTGVEALEAENKRLKAALAEIEGMGFDEPAYSSAPTPEVWMRRRAAEMQRIARAALALEAALKGVKG